MCAKHVGEILLFRRKLASAVPIAACCVVCTFSAEKTRLSEALRVAREAAGGAVSSEGDDELEEMLSKVRFLLCVLCGTIVSFFFLNLMSRRYFGSPYA